MPAIAATPPPPGLADLLGAKPAGDGGDGFAPVLAGVLALDTGGQPGTAAQPAPPVPVLSVEAAMEPAAPSPTAPVQRPLAPLPAAPVLVSLPAMVGPIDEQAAATTGTALPPDGASVPAPLAGRPALPEVRPSGNAPATTADMPDEAVPGTPAEPATPPRMRAAIAGRSARPPRFDPPVADPELRARQDKRDPSAPVARVPDPEPAPAHPQEIALPAPVPSPAPDPRAVTPVATIPPAAIGRDNAPVGLQPPVTAPQAPPRRPPTPTPALPSAPSPAGFVPPDASAPTAATAVPIAQLRPDDAPAGRVEPSAPPGLVVTPTVCVDPSTTRVAELPRTDPAFAVRGPGSDRPEPPRRAFIASAGAAVAPSSPPVAAPLTSTAAGAVIAVPASTPARIALQPGQPAGAPATWAPPVAQAMHPVPQDMAVLPAPALASAPPAPALRLPSRPGQQLTAIEVERAAAPAPAVVTPMPASVPGPAQTGAVAAPANAVLPALQAFGAALHRAAVAERRPVLPESDAVVPLSAVPPAPIVATAPLSAPVDTTQPRWPEAMMARIEHLREIADAADTRIRLHPDALGAIDVAVRREGEGVLVHLAAAEPATRALLAEAQPRLVELAESRGLRLTQTAVDSGGPGAGSGGERGSRQPAPDHPRAPRPALTPDAPAEAGVDDRIA